MPPSPQARGPYAKTAGRIDHILEVSTGLFAVNGYRATTMKQIALRAGMSQPGLMHHFPTKDDLLIGVLRRRDEQAMARADASPRRWTVESLVDTVAHDQYNPALAALDCVLSAEATAPDHPAHEYYRDRAAWVRARLTNGFAELGRRGRLRTEVAPESLATMLLAVLEGLKLQRLLAPHAVDMVAVTRDFLSMFVTSVPGDEVRPPA